MITNGEIGDIIVLMAGDIMHADCVIINNGTVFSNESSLSGKTRVLLY